MWCPRARLISPLASSGSRRLLQANSTVVGKARLSAESWRVGRGLPGASSSRAFSESKARRRDDEVAGAAVKVPEMEKVEVKDVITTKEDPNKPYYITSPIFYVNAGEFLP